MLITAAAVICQAAAPGAPPATPEYCIEKVITDSDQNSNLSMTGCQMNAQMAIAEWLGNNYPGWRLQSFRCVLGKFEARTHV